jgi:hypothetical protein
MKAVHVFFTVMAAVAMLVSCSTVSDLVSGQISGGAAKAVSAETADFKADELLCGNGDTMMETRYMLAKITTPASAATKNQAEVLYVRDGSKEWVVYGIKSHKARKDELKIDTVVFYPGGWAEYDSIGGEDYRKATWMLGRITSTDEMFKNIVEVNGQKYYVLMLRIPDQSVE